MRKLIILSFIALFLVGCEKNETISDTCITSCPPSTPGKINIAIEDHTGLEIKNMKVEINGEMVAFNLIPKTGIGKFSCWKTYDQVDAITMIEFEIGDNVTHLEAVNYTNLASIKEYAIDIRSHETLGIQVQLVASPDCISSSN